MSYYHIRPSTIFKCLEQIGYTGTLSDKLYTFWQTLSSGTIGTRFDHMRKALTLRGYTGTIDDQLIAFFKNETGITDTRRAEQCYWDRQFSLNGRYGINTSGLLLWLDMYNSISRGNSQTWYDISGNNNHFSAPSAAARPDLVTITPTVLPVRDFDGSSDLLTIADSDSFSFTTGSEDIPFSIAAWVYVQAGTVTQPIIVKRTDLTGSITMEYVFRLLNTEILSFICYSDNTGSNYIGRVTTGAVADGWHHLVGTYDGSGTTGGFVLYKDGATGVGTASSGGSYTCMQNTTIPPRIGYQESDAGTNYWQGGMGSIMIFRNYVLTGTDVTALYNTDKVRYGL